jgi:hypothetical protein
VALGQRRERGIGRRPSLRREREKIQGTWPVPCLKLNDYMAHCIYSSEGLSLQATETDLDLTYDDATVATRYSARGYYSHQAGAQSILSSHVLALGVAYH